MSKILGFIQRNWPVALVALAVLAGRSSFADHYIVPSGSMEHTLVPGDRVLVDKMAYGLRLPFTALVIRDGEMPVAGDIVIFDSPEDGTRLIKRVVAIGGSAIEVKSGHLSIDGEALATGPDTERIGDAEVRINLRFGGGPDVPRTIIPEGHVMVIGDSRGNSRDSRYFGMIPVSELYARASRVYFRSEDGFVWLPL